MLLFYLFIASVTFLFGAGIALFFREKHSEFTLIFGFTAGAVLGIVLWLMVHLFTEVGYPTIIVMWGGFILIWLLEKLTHRMRDRLGTDSTESKQNIWAVSIAVIGLSIHSVADGFNLSIAAEEKTFGIALALGVLLHRLPVATVITAALRRNYNILYTCLWIMPLIVAPFIGAFMGEHLLHGIFKELTEYLTAFAAGTLLHVVMDGFSGRHEPSKEKVGNAAKITFAVGLIITICAMYFIPGFEHDHVH